jgi:putative addiction module component (TIGR02574 family)
MTSSLKTVEQQATALNAEDRAQLAEVLLESLHTEVADIERAWQAEIEARVAAYDRGEVKLVDAAEVFAEARRLPR